MSSKTNVKQNVNHFTLVILSEPRARSVEKHRPIEKLDFILWIDKSSILTKHLSEASSETLEVPWYELGPFRTWTVSRRVSRSGSFYLINKVYN